LRMRRASGAWKQLLSWPGKTPEKETENLAPVAIGRAA
jgi:hypothetical protein